MKTPLPRWVRFASVTRFAAGMLLAVSACLIPSHELLGQGCVAVRGGGMCSLGQIGIDGHHHFHHEHSWQISLGYRWLHSFRHFAGDVEHRHRVAQGTEVINDSHFFDVGITYDFSPRYSAALVIPFVYSDRSSFYEHSGGSPATGAQRFHTSAGGLGDVRLGAYGWVWDPSKRPRGNVQLGLGLKLPTGNHKATDTFMTPRGPEIHYVDQSIQPGDGGWGFTGEILGWRQIHERVTLYAQGFYLFNPESVNGVPTRARNPRTKTYENLLARAAAGDAVYQQYLANAQALGHANFRSLEDVMAITDQYLGRGGAVIQLVPSWGFSFSLGGRIEGIPVRDAFGRTDGFRRPGYTVSVEPGLGWIRGTWTASVLVPVAVYRNREPSVADQRWGGITGLGTRGGDAAFADFVVTASVAKRF